MLVRVFVTQESTAQMPGSVRSRYVHIGILEVTPEAAAITGARFAFDERRRAVVEIVCQSDPLYDGTTEQSQSWREWRACEAAVADLNKLYRRGQPNAGRLFEFVKKHGPKRLPRDDRHRLAQAIRLVGTVGDVLGVHGWDGFAKAVIEADPAALALRARLGERKMVLLDRAINATPVGLS